MARTAANNPGGTAAPPRTFICYRGGTTGNSAGKEIAECVFGMISEAEGYAPVFLAEKIRYDYISDLDAIFQSVEKFVVVYNVNFFSGFFLESGDENDVKPNPESSTLWELKAALEHRCELYAVFSGEFSWNQIDAQTLKRLERFYGKEGLGRLRHISNPYLWKQSGNPADELLRCFNKISLNGIRSFVNTLEAETERKFEEAVTAFANRNNNESTRENLREIIEEENGSDSGYAAFYILQIMLRQLKEFRQMRENFERYGALFSSRTSYSHIRVLYLIESGTNFDVDEALTLSEKDCEEYPNNAGYVHLFADVYATACERAEPQEREALIAAWGERAETMVERAIRLDDNYAKYYCTKARILALRRDYRGAERQISQAIDKEDSGRKDYLIRLLNYQYYKTMIQVEKKLDLLSGRTEK